MATCDADQATLSTLWGPLSCQQHLVVGGSLLSMDTAGMCHGRMASVQKVYFPGRGFGFYESITMVSPNGTSTTLLPPFPADLRVSEVCPTACGTVDVGSCAPCAATTCWSAGLAERLAVEFTTVTITCI